MHAFKVGNAKWMLKNILRRKPKIFEVVRMTTKYVLKYWLPMRYDLTIKIPKIINIMKMRVVTKYLTWVSS